MKEPNQKLNLIFCKQILPLLPIATVSRTVIFWQLCGKNIQQSNSVVKPVIQPDI